ncbi:hypothetical protein KIPB_002711 [Kipferlia bialata]|uniref:Uncharacterized protein n=1 Tax=Kipferlia bialata TaxID=797122 RepID=A0A391NSM3_9EUKA|nr:hypothetical protein KIPB_002711 [Kipferlia bialata]|eukprot:g2711.t1
MVEEQEQWVRQSVTGLAQSLPSLPEVVPVYTPLLVCYTALLFVSTVSTLYVRHPTPSYFPAWLSGPLRCMERLPYLHGTPTVPMTVLTLTLLYILCGVLLSSAEDTLAGVILGQLHAMGAPACAVGMGVVVGCALSVVQTRGRGASVKQASPLSEDGVPIEGSKDHTHQE